jgi:hypothetical protein
MTPTSTPDQALAGILRSLHGMPVFVAGSCVAAQAHAMPASWSDLDVFVPTEQVLIATVQSLLSEGYVIHDRFDRVWQRWLRYGLKGWHTNSMRLQSLTGVETNVVYKITEGHPTTSLAQVLESFDFGLLGMGYDVETNMFRDLRPYLFPGRDVDGPLPLMPSKQGNWRAGFISQYNGMREANRYVKYSDYGYDMSAVKEDLVTGYMQVSMYHSTSFDEDKQLLGQIYARLAVLIDDDGLDELREFYATMDYKDPLEQMLDALE